MDIVLMTDAHELWGPTIEYARKCSWSAGVSLAEEMRQGGFTDWERVLVAVENDTIAGYCTFEGIFTRAT